MRPFDHKRILLGVTGGIAAYKAAWLARLLTQWGASVDVVLTRAASEFVGAITFEALTGRPVHTALIAQGHALDHIRLAKAADVVVVAPATADFLARAVAGNADDLLTAALLATRAPVLVVPAMNDNMWAHRAVRENCARARELGYSVLEPEDGPLAAGEGSGPGRMPEPERIAAHVARLLEPRGALHGKRVVVTAGASREQIDPVRFISNHSTGRMGVAIAEAAWRRGADARLICGHVDVPLPSDIPVSRVGTTEEMRDAVAKHLPDADVLIMSAAPADFTVHSPSPTKLKKSQRPDSIELAPAVDILQDTIALRPHGLLVVGFALETGNAEAEGARKLRDKSLDMIVVNDATEDGAGFGHDTNRVSILSRSGDAERLPLMSKRDVADALLDRIESRLNGR